MPYYIPNVLMISLQISNSDSGIQYINFLSAKFLLCFSSDDQAFTDPSYNAMSLFMVNGNSVLG